MKCLIFLSSYKNQHWNTICLIVDKAENSLKIFLNGIQQTLTSEAELLNTTGNEVPHELYNQNKS